MKFQIGNTATPHGKSLADLLSCLVAVCVSFPALAAPGDLPVPPRSNEDNTNDRPAGTSFEYLSIAGATFHPLDSATTYSYPGNGCIAKTGGSSKLFTRKVILPDDVVARYIRLYYYDTSSADAVAFFTTYDGAGNFNQRVSASSMGGPSGYSSALSSDMGYPVDRFTDAINMVVNLGDQNDSTLQFCGVRIAYDAPITDRIFANGFDMIPL